MDPVSNYATIPVGTPALTAQSIGLIALGLAIILTVTRLSRPKRPRSGGPSDPGDAES
jgi:hypothetical protein